MREFVGFLYGGYNKDRNKIHLVKQDSICWPQIEGGLGLRKMHNINKAFIVKLDWGIIHDKCNF
jgi:hypothetical protein